MKKKNNKGITLIALVITIVILIILAGITISQLTGENGLFARAKQAKEDTENVTNEENKILEQYANLMDDYIENSGTPRILSAEEISFTPNDTNWNVENVKEALDYLYNN